MRERERERGGQMTKCAFDFIQGVNACVKTNKRRLFF